MNRFFAFAAAVICLSACTSAVTLEYTMEEPVDYVSTLVGTMSKHSLSTGNTYPAVGMPWGTDFWTPQTGRNGDGWTYCYSADKIVGLKRTHQPSPWINDYGAMSIMPVTTGPVHDQNERASWFSHKAEKATPYSYEVYLADHDVYAELAPTQHACSFRFTYPESEMSYLVVDGYDERSYVEVVGKNRIVGYVCNNHGGVPENFRDWFVIESDTEFVTSECDGHTYAMVGFPTKKGQKVNVKVASSFISLDQADVNMKELAGKDLDSVKAEGRKAWNDVLSRFITT
ncbi:MAG: glycoside hydrolase family 92 protein, partial [Bacteroidales bacterium]|nr:glycoside hydrolase family 92 protein [Bacteroidales bacterium]